jgi:MFS transporter, ACS family, glucarate transporter
MSPPLATRIAAPSGPSAPPAPQQEKRTNYRWVVMGLIFCIWAIACADRANFGIALPYMKKEFHITNTEAGLIVSLFSFAYALVQIPVGMLYRRLGEKASGIFLALCMVFTSLFTALMATTSSVLLLQLYRIGLGLAEGPLGIGCTNVINRWFPPQEKGLATGLWIAASKLGPLMVPSVCLIVIAIWGWREIFYVFAVPGFLFAILWIFMVTNSPSESRFCSPAEQRYIRGEDAAGKVGNAGKKNAAGLRYLRSMPLLDAINRTRRVERLQTIRQVFTSWNIIGVALGYGCMIGITNIFMSWIPTYLVTVRGFESVKMGFLASAPFIGAVTGNMIGGLISDRLLDGRRKPMMLLGAVGTTLMLCLLIEAPDSVVYLGCTLLISGLMVGIGFAGYSAYAMGLVSKSTYPTAFGIVNFLGQIGGAVAPLMVGILLDHYGWSSVFMYMVGTALLCVVLVASVVEPVAEPEL